jgi:Cu+-exporting ATPase
VESILEKCEGVSNVTVDLKQGKATVLMFDSADYETILKQAALALSAEGYSLTVDQINGISNSEVAELSLSDNSSIVVSVMKTNPVIVPTLNSTVSMETMPFLERNESLLNSDEIFDSLKSVEIDISGMSCSACSGSIETALLKVPGVKSCVVALLSQRAKVVYYENQLSSVQVLLTRIFDLGFEGRLVEERLPTGKVDFIIHGYLFFKFIPLFVLE